MKIVVDENIEFGEEIFSRFGKVEKVHGRKITNEMLTDADALIVRSITKVNKDLLDGTSVKFVGTATIGTDHLDTEYLDSNNIRYASAPGCNSYAVTEYLFSALSKIAKEKGFDLTDKSIGIIGYGNIGTKIARYAESLGMKYFVNDPPLQRKSDTGIFSSLDEALTADIITCHVPLNKEGIDKTVHLLNAERIDSLKPGTILINSSRGPVVDNNALAERLKSKNDITAVLDVWENEPRLNTELLDRTFIATPHIAGYSLEGKVNGSVMVYHALCDHLGVEPSKTPDLKPVENSRFELKSADNITEILKQLIEKIYPIENDSAALKNLSGLPADQLAVEFDLLRKNYRLRREFNNYSVKEDNLSSRQIDILKTFRFSII